MQATEGSSAHEGSESQAQIRRKKRDEWADKGIAAYPTAQTSKPKDTAKELKSRFDSLSRDELEEKAKTSTESFSIAGRVLLHRSFGKSTFLTLRDRTGKIQIFAQLSKLPAEIYEMIKHIDLGDILFAEGGLFKTKTGELTLDVSNVRLLSKSVLPLPEKFHGLQDVEQRYRQRYLDLICNEGSAEVFKVRSQIVHLIRDFFLQRDYVEVETPMLHSLVTGAAARPFQTFHNTLKMDLFLRIAPELYLKRLVVGGLDRVFEMNRCFRNEGISIKHNPEFTMLEFYEAYADYEDLMAMTEELFALLAMTIKNGLEFEYQGQKISFRAPFRRLSVLEALQEYLQGDVTDHARLKKMLEDRKLEVSADESLAKTQWRCFEEFVEDKLIQPTFIIDHPIEVSPLARRSEERPSVAERFELYVAGREIANGFNELNDPDDQRKRFEDQAQQKNKGDEEAMDYDADYIQALEYGLPPTAGEGIGIDRLTMLLTDSASIRDVILFPQLRPTVKNDQQ